MILLSNFQNDMWRIVGYVFNDKTYFIRGKTFDKEGIKAFCTAKGIALPIRPKIIREKNASDNICMLWSR